MSLSFLKFAPRSKDRPPTEQMGPFLPELENTATSESSAHCMAPSADRGSEGELRMEGVLSGFQFIWQSPETLAQFVDAANNLSPESKDTKPPSWISQPRGSITAATFVTDLLKYLAELGGGLHEDTKLIMPNTPTQAYNICRRLGHVEMDPFMQACMVELPDDAHFASVMRLFEDPGINACPVYFVAPPPPFRQLFF